MKRFEVKYRQYGPMLDGGSHIYNEVVRAKTSRGASGLIKREVKEIFNENPAYRVEILVVNEV